MDFKEDSSTATFLTSLIFGDFYEQALDLLNKYPGVVLIKDVDRVTAMDALSRKPSAFKSSFPTRRSGIGTLGYYFQNFMYSLLDVHVDAKNACCHTRGDVENSFDANGERTQGSFICGKGLSLCFHGLFQNALKLVPGHEHIYHEKLKHNKATVLLKEVWRLVSEISDLGHVDIEDVVVAAMFQATQNGIVEFIQDIIDNCPQPLSQLYPKSEGSDYEGQTIFHYAIINRQENIFRLIHGLGPTKNDLARLADNSKNLMLHLAAKLAPIQRLNQVPGAALQFQRELLWYKEVEEIIPSTHEEFQNKDNKTPKMLFIEEHKELLNDGATWMKETATQCMVVATLITTIMFAAVFTIPGSKESDHTGEPNYIHGKFPIVYVISNILALCSSVASMLIILTIITSRYSEEDFLRTLPQMLMMGLFFLFFSIVGMMIEFVSAILIMLHFNVLWVSVPIVVVASIPITIYALVELPLFIQLIFATTSADVFGKKPKKA
ncbi:ankyrin repeat-containing protein NPR4-like [Telopea speciosissima]|uniref:ankyrin repeat-containing protein NPR4-like n=1 Tax=Telopea speciosissima TaxID=54955 RepID=UPI001CC72288|nr:ankyrin repeat-containing protein NPR4-like [Telopea speciosissima]